MLPMYRPMSGPLVSSCSSRQTYIQQLPFFHSTQAKIGSLLGRVANNTLQTACKLPNQV
jgi:hypothetical protein